MADGGSAARRFVTTSLDRKVDVLKIPGASGPPPRTEYSDRRMTRFYWSYRRGWRFDALRTDLRALALSGVSVYSRPV
jgi:hypothetical protein